MSEKQKVLAVDDEPRNQRIVSETLEDVVELKAVSSGEEALNIIESYAPDLVLLDIMMPGIDGYEVCQTIRANPRLSLTKIILVSGKAMIEERLKGYDAGADDYMTKPFVPEELLAKTKVFLRLAAVERQFAELNRSLDEKVQEKTRELLEAQAKLTTAAKMSALGEMAGGIAHEINTPLASISLLADQIKELVSEETSDRKIVLGMTQTIEDPVNRISSIIRGLRTFSRDGSKDRFGLVPIKQIIDNTLSLCREKFKHSSVHVQVGAIPGDFLVHCQQVQISQVLLNLIQNAYDAVVVRQERWIKIEVERQQNLIRISITDSGAGIADKISDKMFQPFFTTKDIGKGSGLGLSISKGIVESHRGSLLCDRQCNNTRFILSLPTSEASVNNDRKAA